MALNRRGFLASVSALAVAPSVTAAGQVSSKGAKTDTYVLVHGGGHGGWCYQRVARILRAHGHDVYTPTLTGLGERVHLARPDTDLDTHITDVVNVMKYEDLTNVILLGHSYGGLVITGVADRATSRIAHLVYLDASHPRNGQSLSSSAGKESADRWRTTSRMVNGTALIPLDVLDAAQLQRFGLTKPEDIAWAKSKMTGHPLKSFTQPLQMTNEAAVSKIPRTDINRKGSKPSSVPRPPDRYWEIDDPGHDLMITSPQVLADMLMKLSAL